MTPAPPECVRAGHGPSLFAYVWADLSAPACEKRCKKADLVTLGANSTVNRGCVVQTHLFHDSG